MKLELKGTLKVTYIHFALLHCCVSSRDLTKKSCKLISIVEIFIDLGGDTKDYSCFE